jgi:hypothetical protein
VLSKRLDSPEIEHACALVQRITYGLLARRFPGLQPADREDIAQDAALTVLCNGTDFLLWKARTAVQRWFRARSGVGGRYQGFMVLSDNVDPRSTGCRVTSAWRCRASMPRSRRPSP